MVDRSLRCCRWNRRWLELTGLDAASAVGRTLVEMLPGMGRWLAERADAVFASGTSAGQVERVDPETGRVWRIHCAPFGPGPDVQAACILLDTVAFEDSEQPRWLRFLGQLAHELRNPLTPILTSAWLLRKHGLERPELLESAAAGIERQVWQMTRLIDDCSDLSRAGRGTLTVRQEVAVLRDLLQRAVDPLRPHADRHRQSLSAEWPPASLLVRVDGDRLVRCLELVLTHALTYAPEGGEIRIGAAVDGAVVHLRIAQGGTETTPEELARLFEPAAVLAVPRHKGPAVLGIGLALARRLLELQGGSISARSVSPAAGTLFEITLPLVAADSVGPQD